MGEMKSSLTLSQPRFVPCSHLRVMTSEASETEEAAMGHQPSPLLSLLPRQNFLCTHALFLIELWPVCAHKHPLTTTSPNTLPPHSSFLSMESWLRRDLFKKKKKVCLDSTLIKPPNWSKPKYLFYFELSLITSCHCNVYVFVWVVCTVPACFSITSWEKSPLPQLP